MYSKPAPAASPWYVSAIPTDLTPPPVADIWAVRVCDHLFKVYWHQSPGATGYDLNMSLTKGKTWQRVMTNKNNNGWKMIYWTKNKTFWFGVRAVNAHGASEWRNVESIAPPCPVEGLQASYAANGDMTATWQPAKRATSYDVNFSADAGRSWQRMESNISATSASFYKNPSALPYNPNFLVAVQSRKGNITGGWRNAPITRVQLTADNIANTTATLNLSEYAAQWWYDADTGPHTTCQGPVAANDSDEDLTGLTEHQQYTYKAYTAAGCNAGDLLASVTFEPSGDVLSVENVTATTATLKIENHTGQWWYKADTGPDSDCQGPVAAGTTTVALSLIPGTEYTYKSYDVSTCADTHEGASVTFTTGGVSVSNLDENSVADCSFGGQSNFTKVLVVCGTGFTTGNASNGYTLHSVTGRFKGKSGTPTGFSIALHAASGSNPGSVISTATLSGSAPETAGEYTYTCSGSGCELAASTTYYVLLSTSNQSGEHFYRLETTSATSETLTPLSNGWLIADKGVNRQTTDNSDGWSVGTYANKIKVAATVK